MCRMSSSSSANPNSVHGHRLARCSNTRSVSSPTFTALSSFMQRKVIYGSHMLCCQQMAVRSTAASKSFIVVAGGPYATTASTTDSANPHPFLELRLTLHAGSWASGTDFRFKFLYGLPKVVPPHARANWRASNVKCDTTLVALTVACASMHQSSSPPVYTLVICVSN